MLFQKFRRLLAYRMLHTINIRWLAATWNHWTFMTDASTMYLSSMDTALGCLCLGLISLRSQMLRLPLLPFTLPGGSLPSLGTCRVGSRSCNTVHVLLNDACIAWFTITGDGRQTAFHYVAIVYTPCRCATPTGFEPATSSVTGKRANQTAPRSHCETFTRSQGFVTVDRACTLSTGGPQRQPNLVCYRSATPFYHPSQD